MTRKEKVALNILEAYLDNYSDDYSSEMLELINANKEDIAREFAREYNTKQKEEWYAYEAMNDMQICIEDYFK